MCIQQYFSYSLIAMRDLYADMTLLLILGAIHAQLIFLRQLLDELIREKKIESLRYWIRQHQDILLYVSIVNRNFSTCFIRILNQFESVCGGVLFATYSYVAIFSFYIIVRLTEDSNFDIAQQAIIILMVYSNMVHMYIISAIGDDVADSVSF